MATVTLSQEQNSYIVYNRQVSTDSGWENPFRPGGDLSREADEIVELIKEGKPITPTPTGLGGNTSPKLPQLAEDVLDNGHSHNGLQNADGAAVTKTKLSNDLGHSPKTKVTNASANGVPDPKSANQVEVQRATVVPAGDASQIEHVLIKKKAKCQCCSIQ